MDFYHGLVIFRCRKYIRSTDGNSRVARDEFFHHTANGFQSQRERSDIEQEDIFNFSS